MDLQARKYQLIQEVFKIEKPDILDKLEKLLKAESSNEIVASTVEGQPLTKAEYKKELQKAEQEVLKGEFTTQENLEREIENW